MKKDKAMAPDTEGAAGPENVTNDQNNTGSGDATNDTTTGGAGEQTAASDGAEGEQPTKGKSVFDQKRYRYAPNGVSTPSGRKSVDTGDAVAVALRGKSAQDVVDLVIANGGQSRENWGNLNPGLLRMSASNVLRGLLSRNGKIVVDGAEIVKAVTTAPAASDSQAA